MSKRISKRRRKIAARRFVRAELVKALKPYVGLIRYDADGLRQVQAIMVEALAKHSGYHYKYKYL